MDREAWRATVHGIARVEHNLATKPPLPVIFMPVEPGDGGTHHHLPNQVKAFRINKII